MGLRSAAIMTIVRVSALVLCFQCALMYAPVALAQPPAAQPTPPAAGRGGRGPIPVGPRVQIRTYRFADTNEDIPYAIFVSSRVSRDKKNPLIVTLHGLGGTHTTMMRPNALDLDGDMDEAVPVSLSRNWAEVMKTLKMTHQYIEVPGGTHGSVISGSMPDIFAFFAKHSKPASR
jgi:hypothetical protein